MSTDMDDLCEATIRDKQKVEGVAYVFETAKVSEATIPAAIKEKIINDYIRNKSFLNQDGTTIAT